MGMRGGVENSSVETFSFYPKEVEYVYPVLPLTFISPIDTPYEESGVTILEVNLQIS